MLNENLENQQNIGLGVNSFDKTQEQLLPQDDVCEQESYFGKPEKYDYSDVQLPENYCYDEELLNEFNALAAKYNLSQKSANELMSIAVKLTQNMSNGYSEAMAEQHRQKVANYKQNLVNDREIGGSKYNATLKTANIAYNQFADADVQSLLDETGLNCHPKIVKMFYNIGKKMQNDFIHTANAAAVQKENREDILFPTMS